MSLNFSANQFEAEFKASRLKNWEVPKWFPHNPCQNHGKTHGLSNERGHLLPGVPRSIYNPWGNFIGTWDLPKNITRHMATELSAPSRDRLARWRAHCRLCEEKGRGLKTSIDITTDIDLTDSNSGQKGGAGSQSEESSACTKPECSEPNKVYCPIHDSIF